MKSLALIFGALLGLIQGGVAPFVVPVAVAVAEGATDAAIASEAAVGSLAASEALLTAESANQALEATEAAAAALGKAQIKRSTTTKTNFMTQNGTDCMTYVLGHTMPVSFLASNTVQFTELPASCMAWSAWVMEQMPSNIANVMSCPTVVGTSALEYSVVASNYWYLYGLATSGSCMTVAEAPSKR